MYFFGFLPPTNENVEKKTLKCHFLGRIFFFIEIAYITRVKAGFVLNAVNTPKTLKNTSFIIFFPEKSILWQYSVFFVYCLMKTMK